MPESTTCPACGTSLPATSRNCSSCGHVLGAQGAPAVAAAVAPDDRLSDSGAIELRNLLVNETRGDYEILEEVGRGGMAVVYRATEVHLARTVAIKILPPELTFAKGATERFRREARTAAALDHANIIPIYRISSSGRLFWYAMKFLEGNSLAEILQQKGRLTVPETLAILDQVALALDYAHQRSVVHRDIKPGNIMLDPQNRVIVTDFGIAKELSGSGLTGSGAILGTPYYMSPEQCRGGELTGAADQYSTAVMAFQMLSGHPPFEADSAIDVIHKHVSEPPPSLGSMMPGIPRHVSVAISRGLAKKPAERYPTVAAFVDALRNEQSEATLIMSRRIMLGSGRAIPVGLMRRRLLAMAAAATVIIGGSVFAAMQLMPGEAGDTGALAAPAGDSMAAPDSSAQQAAPGTRRPAQPGGNAPAPGASASGSQGYLRIRIVNGWANITVAGRTLEQQRVWADSLPPGTYSATFEREGYLTVTRSVTVRPGQSASLQVSMTAQEPSP